MAMLNNQRLIQNGDFSPAKMEIKINKYGDVFFGV
jgi:hypothetical protein